MHMSLAQGIARAQVAERVRQAEQARLSRTAAAERTPRQRQPFGFTVQWPTLWLPRPVDVHAAIGRPTDLDPRHDGRLVADIVRERAEVHGEAFELQLTGTAGGRFSQGEGSAQLTLDALDFVRTLSGRLPGVGVMRHLLPL